MFETGIIINQEGKSLIKKIFSQQEIVKTIENLAAITIRLPAENLFTPGVYYFILKVLAWEKINIIEVLSTYCEFTIIVKNKDIDRAFSILKEALI